MRLPKIPERFAIPIQTLFYALTDREKSRLMRIKTHHLTYLAAKDLFNLYDAAKAVEHSGIAGLFIEAGCALGGSAIAIGWAKQQQREFRLYDAFGLIPPPSEKDESDVHLRYEEIKSGKSKGLGNNRYYGYVENLQAVVAANLAKHGVPVEAHNIKLIKGYFEDTLYINEPVAFAHIDCDWYASVMSCVIQIEPNLTIGGKIVFDDYHEWSGCRLAVDEYFKDKSGYVFAPVGKKLHVTKIA
ncbi:TylF/MycF/NovP-related O-methyltransferase [Parapedobacter sp. GCM10030251]|uniref:TylF/MycF/NovP-related O-methyltransferase n=1 Tax=Parapedobacter sp. GCM10030251 TaxID=3273419 RepID=UPI00361F1C67